MTVKAKGSALKKALSKALKQNRRIPVFVIARTRRRVTRNTKQRSWKHSKLKINVQRRHVRN